MKIFILALLCALALVASAMASDNSSAITAGDLQEICIGSNAESNAACRYYILGITQGITLGMGIADGKSEGGRPCIPERAPSSALELAVKMKLGQDLMVYPSDKKLDASGLIGAILASIFPCQKAR